MKLSKMSLFALMAVVFFSCKKKEDDPGTIITNTVGEVGFEFTNYAGNTELVMNTGKYVNANGDTFSVTKFNYYITNIRLKKSDGTYYGENESYHLVQGDVGASKHFHLESIPTGTYTEVSFTIGVDSARNTSGAQTGALDPSNGMFWTWSTGYIMAKMEGTSPKSPASDKTFQHHIGGFSGANNAVRTVTFNLTASPIVLASGKESSVMVKADVLKWFSPNIINLATTNNIMMVNSASKSIADNYANMFSISSVTNE